MARERDTERYRRVKKGGVYKSEGETGETERETRERYGWVVGGEKTRRRNEFSTRVLGGAS